jgi:ATP-dependent RNA helicase RhlE
MEGFRRGDFQIMVATNIAARGLDVDHITHVISTDVPDVPEDYVHRIGRTGRAGATGDAFILVAREEEGALARIERQVGLRLPRITLPDFDYAAPAPPKSAGSGDGERGRRSGPQSPGRGPAKPSRGGPPPSAHRGGDRHGTGGRR